LEHLSEKVEIWAKSSVFAAGWAKSDNLLGEIGAVMDLFEGWKSHLRLEINLSF